MKRQFKNLMIKKGWLRILITGLVLTRLILTNGFSITGSSAQTSTKEDIPITLEKAIAIALANNPEVKAVEWDNQAAKANQKAVAGEQFPSFSLSGAYSHHLDEQRLIPSRSGNDPGVLSKEIFAGDINFKMPLFTGGKIKSEIKTATFQQKAAEQRLTRARQDIIFSVSQIFYYLLGQDKVIKSLEFSKKAMEEHRRKTVELIKAQKAAKVDLLHIEVRLADLAQQLVKEEGLLAAQYRFLANLLGINESADAIAIQGELTLVNKEKPDLISSLLRAKNNRPDYLADRALLESQASRINVQAGERWPEVYLKGSYGYRYADDPGISPIGSNDLEDVGSIGLYLEMPIFEGGRIQSRIRQEQSKLSAAKERLRKFELQIRLEVETSIINVASSKKQVEATQKAIELAEESLRIEREKYELGKGSISDVLDAQAALLNAQTNFYRGLAEYKSSLAQLELAEGVTMTDSAMK